MNTKVNFIKSGIYILTVIVVTIALVSVDLSDTVRSILQFAVIDFILIVLFFNYTKAGKDIMCYLRGICLSSKCKHSSRKIKVGKGVRVFHPEKISLGKNVEILQEAVFAPYAKNNEKYPSEIIVGNNVHFGVQDRIASANKVVIEDDVLFAAFVHITDHSHEFHNVGKPIINQGIYSKGPVIIKRGAWLAFGCHVLSGVTVGEYSVVAANSVVTKDVPAYSVVAGNPARIVSQYDFEEKKWVSCK